MAEHQGLTLILYPSGQQTMACGPNTADGLFLYNWAKHGFDIF